MLPKWRIDKGEHQGNTGPQFGPPAKGISEGRGPDDDNSTYWLVAIFNVEEVPKALFILWTTETTEVQMFRT